MNLFVCQELWDRSVNEFLNLLQISPWLVRVACFQQQSVRLLHHDPSSVLPLSWTPVSDWCSVPGHSKHLRGFLRLWARCSRIYRCVPSGLVWSSLLLSSNSGLQRVWFSFKLKKSDRGFHKRGFCSENCMLQSDQLSHVYGYHCILQIWCGIEIFSGTF